MSIDRGKAYPVERPSRYPCNQLGKGVYWNTAEECVRLSA